MNLKWGRSITDGVKAAIEGGVTMIQLRFGAVLFFFWLGILEQFLFVHWLFNLSSFSCFICFCWLSLCQLFSHVCSCSITYDLHINAHVG